MQWKALFKKEMLENWRNKKWLWVPIVFILLAIMDPITNYFMEDILSAVGGLPDGTVIEFPDLTPPEVIMMSLGQIGTLGILVVALISMGTISGEIKSGISELVLVKPVSYANYITSKFVSWLLLIWGSFLVGILSGWYYVTILYGKIPVSHLLLLLLFYGLWLAFVISLSIFYNTLFKSPGMVVFSTLATILILSGVSGILNNITWSPSHISSYIGRLLLEGTVSKELIGSGTVALVLSALLLFTSIKIFNKRELAK